MSVPFNPIEIHDLTVSYEQKPVLYGVDLEIEEGSLVGIIGPNGAGKSTLIKTMMDMKKDHDLSEAYPFDIKLKIKSII